MRPWHFRRWPKFFRDTYFPSQSTFNYRPDTPAGIYLKLSKAPIFEHYTFKNIYQSVWVFAGCMISLSIIGVIHQYGGLPEGFPIMYAALGASATIMFHQPSAPFTQPYHILLGHTLCPAISVTMQKIIPSQPWLAAALAGSLGITIMGLLGIPLPDIASFLWLPPDFTSSGGVNPPGGALAVLYPLVPQLHVLGYLYIPGALVGIGIMWLVGFVINNLQREFQQPYQWL